MNNPVSVKVGSFTNSPGARYLTDGDFSGEEFRWKMLEEHFEGSGTYKIIVNLDGASGYPTSFLEEAFGGLVRIFTYSECKSRLEFISKRNPMLIQEIEQYMYEAKDDNLAKSGTNPRPDSYKK